MYIEKVGKSTKETDSNFKLYRLLQDFIGIENFTIYFLGNAHKNTTQIPNKNKSK